jgi:hypothetical protein
MILRVRTVSTPWALQAGGQHTVGIADFQQAHAVFHLYPGGVAHPQQVVTPVHAADLVQPCPSGVAASKGEMSPVPCWASYQARKVRLGTPRSGPISCLGLRSVSMRA